MKSKFNIVLIAIILTLLACEQEKVIEVNNSDSEPKITVYGSFQAGSKMKFSIYKSMSITYFSETPAYDNIMKDAIVNIYSEGNLLETLSYNSGYNSEHIYFEQQKYTISVSAPGLKSVDANCKAPAKVEILKIEGTSSLDTNLIITKVYFKDPIDIANYYGFKVYSKNKDFTYNQFRQFYNLDPILQHENSIDIDDLTANQDIAAQGGLTFTDELINGKTHAITIALVRDNDFGTPYAGDYALLDTDSIFFELHSLEADYYTHLRTVYLQEKASSDPFAEPINVYSNITNGFGFFTGYSTYSIGLLVSEIAE